MEAKDYVLALKEAGFTQTRIEEITNIPQPTISKIERGEVADVMSKTYRALKRAYDALPKNKKPKAIPATEEKAA